MTDMAYMAQRPYSSTLGSLAHATDLIELKSLMRCYLVHFEVKVEIVEISAWRDQCTTSTPDQLSVWLKTKPKTFPPCSSLTFCNLSPISLAHVLTQRSKLPIKRDFNITETFIILPTKFIDDHKTSSPLLLLGSNCPRWKPGIDERRTQLFTDRFPL
ncbi:hypothetical protein LXL04_033091 [Taraxacum kok-saghyz]